MIAFLRRGPLVPRQLPLTNRVIDRPGERRPAVVKRRAFPKFAARQWGGARIASLA